MRAKELAARAGRFGPAAQATLAGGYAWATTVAPVAWARGASLTSAAAAAVAVVALAAGWLGSRRWGSRGRIATLWGFVLASALAWSASPTVLAPGRLDLFRGITGTLAWALFAFAWAAPALALGQEPQESIDDEPLVARRRIAGREGFLLLGAGALAVGIQAIGWDVSGVERSVLVRFAALAAGLTILDTAVDVALGQYPRRPRAALAPRLKAARPWLVGLGVLALAALAFAIKV